VLVPAVVRALAVLERLAQQRQPMSMARLASDLALPKSSVHGLCNTLLSFGYLRRQADGGLSIGPRVMSLAEAFVASTDVAREFDALWLSAAPQEAPDETVLLSVLDGGDVVYLAARNGTQPLGLAFTPGMRLPAHLAATGRAMLAYLAPARASGTADVDGNALAGAGLLAAMTPRSLTAPAELAAELALTRQRGYSVDDEGVRLGLFCLAAPVFDAHARPVAGIGVCLNKATLDDACLARQQQRVVDIAHALSDRLGGESPAWAASSSKSATSA
jgi:DNA-binding IclR family transcriptional regulator